VNASPNIGVFTRDKRLPIPRFRALIGPSCHGLAMEFWHLTAASEERLLLFPDDDALRSAARWLAATAPERVLLFCAVDDHVHLVIQGTREGAAHHARATTRWLRRLAGNTDIAPARVRPVESRAHLRRCNDYVLLQPTHHGIERAGHPAQWVGSCFQDLVGARLLHGFRPRNLSEALPRLRQRQLWDAVALPTPNGVPLAGFAAGSIVESAIAASATVPEQAESRRGSALQVWAAAAALLVSSGHRTRTAASAMGVPHRTVQRWASRTPDPRAERAIRLQLWLGRHGLSGNRVAA